MNVEPVAKRELVESRCVQGRATPNQAADMVLRELRHEIRHSVSTIAGYTDLARSRIRQQQEIVDALDTIRCNANDIIDLLDSYIGDTTTAKLESLPSNQRVRVGEVAKEIVTVYARAACKREIDLRLSVTGDFPEELPVAPATIRRILHNLVSNAVKYSAPGIVDLALRASRDLLLLRVTNAGCQDSTSTADRCGLSSEGLGLHLVERVITSLGGELDYSTSRRYGVTIEARIPIGIAAPADYSWRRSRESAGRWSTGRVLVLDGDLDNRRLAGFFLKRAGLDVVLFKHAASLTTIDVQRFDAAIIDLQAPDMQGLSASLLLRDRGFRGLILALTGNDSAVPEDTLVDAGIDRVIYRSNSWERVVNIVVQQIEIEPQCPSDPPPVCEGSGFADLRRSQLHPRNPR